MEEVKHYQEVKPYQEVKHYQVNQRYRIVLEKAASTKGIDGFKVESNGDALTDVCADAAALYEYAKKLTTPVPVKEEKNEPNQGS